jgi:hypothetical protein
VLQPDASGAVLQASKYEPNTVCTGVSPAVAAAALGIGARVTVSCDASMSQLLARDDGVA